MGWYRFVGAAGTKMPTTRVPAYRCGTNWSGWLDGAHPTVEDDEVSRTVCFSNRVTGCKSLINILVKNCGSFLIYKLAQRPSCTSRFCGTMVVLHLRQEGLKLPQNHRRTRISRLLHPPSLKVVHRRDHVTGTFNIRSGPIVSRSEDCRLS